MTKLYNLERDKNIKIYGLDIGKNGSKPKRQVVVFGHIDGAYSYCWLESDPKTLVHLNAATPLKAYKDGYRVEL